MTKSIRVNLRFNDEEINQLKEKAGDRPLASFCRDASLGVRIRRPKKPTRYQHYPPEVVRQLSAIGNNLNQITRLAHVAKKSNALELVALIEAVNAVREQAEGLADVSQDV